MIFISAITLVKLLPCAQSWKWSAYNIGGPPRGGYPGASGCERWSETAAQTL